jgi:hypothetical protein
MRHYTTCAGEGRCAVTLEATVADGGQGIAAFVYGGEVSHVGGSALAAPGPELNGKRLSRADVWTATVPGHKDAQLAASVARKLAIACQASVSVAAGVHVDNATPDDLRLIGANADAAVAELLRQLGVAGNGE